MKCPIDNTTLTIAERQGVEIDYCPQCRGVWLDRGELDKIIDRAEELTPRQATQQQPHYEHEVQPHAPARYDEHFYKKKKRESFLGDLFDF